MTCCCDSALYAAHDWGSGLGVQSISGGLSSIRRKVSRTVTGVVSRVGKEAERAGRHVSHSVSSALEHVGNEMQRMSGRVVSMAERNVNRPINLFRNHPEYFAAVGAICMVIPGLQPIGLVLSAAAAVRMERNKRKAAERAGADETYGITDGFSENSVGGGIVGQALDWLKNNSLLFFGLLAVFLVWRKMR